MPERRILAVGRTRYQFRSVRPMSLTTTVTREELKVQMQATDYIAGWEQHDLYFDPSGHVIIFHHVNPELETS